MLSSLTAASSMVARAPVEWMTWSDWQIRVLSDGSAWRVIRAANQIGKTTCVVADMLHEIRGTSPYRPRRFRGPVNVVLVSESIEQMSAPGGILAKLWEMLPVDEVDRRVSFVPGEGIRGVKIPVIRFTSGPGAGSVIALRTYRQDPQTLAGMTIHHVYADEPLPERVYGELAPRLLRHGGTMTVSFTPTLSMPDQAWLRKLVEQGVFSEHHATMIPENATPEGYAVPFLTQEKIDEAKSRWPSVEHALRLDAAWETVVAGRWLTAFSESSVRRIDLAEVDRDAWIVVGIDHGLVVGKQAAVLVAVGARHTDRPRVWILGEYVPETMATPADDAAGILAMLRARGLRYQDVDEWVGDRSTGDGRHMKSKTNAELKTHLWAQAGVRHGDEAGKIIVTPQKWAGSVHAGLGLINAALAEARCWVDLRCVKVADSMRRFAGDSRDPVKDVLDAARYAIERATGRRPVPVVRATYGSGPRAGQDGARRGRVRA